MNDIDYDIIGRRARMSIKPTSAKPVKKNYRITDRVLLCEKLPSFHYKHSIPMNFLNLSFCAHSVAQN